MKSFMKSAICFPFGYINGQKYEDGQAGTKNVPFALQSFKWRLQNLCSILADKANLNRCSNRS